MLTETTKNRNGQSQKMEQFIEFIEIVSPILSWDYISKGQLSNTLNSFRANGIFNFINNKSTSNHVHLSNGDAFKDPVNLVKAVIAWWYYEPVFLSMVAEWRRKNKYCVTMNDRMETTYGVDSAKFILENMTSTNYKDFLTKMNYEADLTELEQLIHFFQGDDRYVAFNLMNLLNNKGTIEVRLKHGSSDGEENTNFVLLLAHFFNGILKSEINKNVEKIESFSSIINNKTLIDYWKKKIVIIDNMMQLGGGGNMNTHKTYLFSYGSNSTLQLSERLSRTEWNVYPATLKNHVRIFAGYSKKWGGAVSSIHPLKNGKVNGMVFEITEAELKRLDKFEKGYSRRILKINIHGDNHIKTLDCHVYIKNNTSFECMPSKKYMYAIRIMLNERANINNVTRSQKIIVRSLGDDGNIVVH